MDLKLHGDIGLPALAVKILGPGQALVRYIFHEHVLVAVEADTDNFKSEVMILLIIGEQVRHFATARSAPSGPEVHHDDLAFKGGDIDGFAI